MIFKKFTLSNVCKTIYLLELNENIKSNNEINVEFCNDEETISIKCNYDNLEDLFKTSTNLEDIHIKCILEKLTIDNFKTINSEKLLFIKNLIDSKLDKLRYDVLIAIEDVVLDKLVYNENEYRYFKKDQYYIFSYSISSGGNLLSSEFIILDKLEEEDIDNVVKTIINDIEWIAVKKRKFENYRNIDLILKNDISGVFFHEYIGHFLEADYFYTSPIRFLKNTCLFSKFLNITENYMCNEDFDDYGSKVYKNIELIKDGYIKNTLSNYTYSNLLNIGNTGNSFYENINKFHSPRMRHMIVHPQKNTLKSIIESTQNGVLIEKVSSGEVNIYSGDFSILVTKAYLIKDGRVLEPLESFSINYNIKDIAKMNMEICCDIKDSQSLCGKGGLISKVKYSTPSIAIRIKKGIEYEL